MNGRSRESFDLDELLHPAQAFGHPSEVVNDADLTLNEKRAILACWASDACAVEAAPELRAAPRGSAVRFDDIMEALRTLDKQANGHRYRSVKHRSRSLWCDLIGTGVGAGPVLRSSDRGKTRRTR